MFKRGVICKKVVGSKKGIGIVLKVGKNYVLLDGEIKKKKYNINHLEPIGYAEIKDESKEELLKLIEASGFKISSKKISNKGKIKRWKKQKG